MKRLLIVLKTILLHGCYFGVSAQPVVKAFYSKNMNISTRGIVPVSNGNGHILVGYGQVKDQQDTSEAARTGKIIIARVDKAGRLKGSLGLKFRLLDSRINIRAEASPTGGAYVALKNMNSMDVIVLEIDSLLEIQWARRVPSTPEGEIYTHFKVWKKSLLFLARKRRNVNAIFDLNSRNIDGAIVIDTGGRDLKVYLHTNGKKLYATYWKQHQPNTDHPSSSAVIELDNDYRVKRKTTFSNERYGGLEVDIQFEGDYLYLSYGKKTSYGKYLSILDSNLSVTSSRSYDILQSQQSWSIYSLGVSNEGVYAVGSSVLNSGESRRSGAIAYFPNNAGSSKARVFRKKSIPYNRIASNLSSSTTGVHFIQSLTERDVDIESDFSLVSIDTSLGFLDCDSLDTSQIQASSYVVIPEYSTSNPVAYTIPWQISSTDFSSEIQLFRNILYERGLCEPECYPIDLHIIPAGDTCKSPYSLTITPKLEGATYTWSDGTNTDTILVDRLGQYQVTAHGGYYANSSDSLTIIHLPVSKDSLYIQPTSAKFCRDSILLTRHPVQSSQLIFWREVGDSGSVQNLASSMYGFPGRTYFLEYANGCGIFQSPRVSLEYKQECLELSIPSVLTPNEDNLNDHLIIKNLSVNVSAKLAIYNSWGKSVFDGLYVPSTWPDRELADGLYYYYLTYGSRTYKGWIELIR